MNKALLHATNEIYTAIATARSIRARLEDSLDRDSIPAEDASRLAGAVVDRLEVVADALGKLDLAPGPASSEQPAATASEPPIRFERRRVELARDATFQIEPLMGLIRQVAQGSEDEPVLCSLSLRGRAAQRRHHERAHGRRCARQRLTWR
jgi:hypothetical protein